MPWIFHTKDFQCDKKPTEILIKLLKRFGFAVPSILLVILSAVGATLGLLGKWCALGQNDFSSNTAKGAKIRKKHGRGEEITNDPFCVRRYFICGAHGWDRDRLLGAEQKNDGNSLWFMEKLWINRCI